MSLVLAHPYAQALAWALIHFVWQGAAIALALVAIQRLGRLAAPARYTTGVVAMAVMLVMPALTFVRLATTAPAAPASIGADERARFAVTNQAQLSAATASVADAPLTTQPSKGSALLTNVILIVWTAGVVFLSLRLFGGWVVARRLARRAISPASAEIQSMARRVAGRLALDRVVSVFQSSAVTVPMMIGWIKPVVLLPAAALSGLSMVQIEALLAHELAHVRRHDYLVNLLQSVVETLLFYHPAVWFISRRTRVDREHCCDDLAVDICDRVVYATALSDLAAMARTPQVALAATDGPLLSRVRRILGQPGGRQDGGSGWLSVCFVALLVGAFAPAAITRGAQASSDQTGVPGGVSGGVAGGVSGGVVGGVVGGVSGGVTGGVLGGIPGGVAGQKPLVEPWRIVPVETSPEPAQTAEQKELELKLRQLAEEKQKLEQARAENELRRTEAQSNARIVEMKEQLGRLAEEYNRAARMREAGTASDSQLAEIKSKMAIVESQITAERADLEFQKADTDLRRRQMAIELEAMKAKLADREGDRALSEKLTQETLDRKLRLDDERAVLEKKLIEMSGAAEKMDRASQLDERKLKLMTLGELDAIETARSGDVVVVAIHGEPDLPNLYVVRPDGTIRFPFLGEIRVQGLTARQIHDALAKRLDDRKLANAAGVEVTLRGTRK